MRLFVAVLIDDKLNREIDSYKSKFELKGIRKTPDNHITLAFIGDVKDVEKVKNALKSVKFKSFQLRTESLRIVPNMISPRRLEIDIVKDKCYDELLSMQKIIADALQKSVNYKEKRKFIPHITIARIKDLNDAQRSELFDTFNRTAFTQRNFKISNFYLVSSILTEKGPVYSVVETYSLS